MDLRDERAIECLKDHLKAKKKKKGNLLLYLVLLSSFFIMLYVNQVKSVWDGNLFWRCNKKMIELNLSAMIWNKTPPIKH